jgi:hypothetical protein
MRGVPRDRRPISPDPSSSRGTSRIVADLYEVLDRVVVEPLGELEATSQRARDQPGPRGSPHQGEARKVEPDRVGARPLADNEIELEVLHGRIQDLLDGARETVDLIDEQHISIFEVGEYRGEVACPFERGPRSRPDVRIHLVGDDVSEAGLAETRGAGQQQVACGLTAASGRLEHYAEVLLQLGLADELDDIARPQGALELVFGGICARDEDLRSLAHDPITLRAVLITSSTLSGPPPFTSLNATRTSAGE